jgi:DhnA family fructose-bisphosphate aldolase class Ia
MSDGLPSGLRARRLFDRASRRSFIVAVDRPLMGGVGVGGPSMRELVRRAAAAEPDAIVLGPGALKQCWDLLAYRGGPAAIVRIDHLLVREFARGSGEHHRMLCSVDEAVAGGADAVLVFLVDGFADGATFADNVAGVSRVVADASRLGVPVIVEGVLWGARSADERDPEALAAVCRIAAELGADIVKTQHTGDVSTMRGVIDACAVPVMVLGGAPTADPRALVDYTAEAIEAGAAGVIFGRNVYLSDNSGTVDELRNLVHGTPR